MGQHEPTLGQPHQLLQAVGLSEAPALEILRFVLQLPVFFVAIAVILLSMISLLSLIVEIGTLDGTFLPCPSAVDATGNYR